MGTYFLCCSRFVADVSQSIHMIEFFFFFCKDLVTLALALLTMESIYGCHDDCDKQNELLWNGVLLFSHETTLFLLHKRC